MSETPKKRGRGRPKGLKNKKVTPKKEIEKMLLAKRIVETGSVVEGYINWQKDKGHQAPRENATQNCWRVLDKEVKEKVQEYLGMAEMAAVNRNNLVKLYQLLIAKFIQGDERVKASDFRSTLDSLSKLVPDFKDRHEVDDISSKPEEVLDQEILDLTKKFGGRSLNGE